MIKKLLILLILPATLMVLMTFKKPSQEKVNTHASFDLDTIRKRGKLIAVTDFNSTDYFIYNGEPMGFNYELLKSFSDHIGIDLEIVAENNINRAREMVEEGEADLIAFGLTSDFQDKGDLLLSDPVDETRQVLVQKKPHNWQKLTDDLIDQKLIRNQKDLATKTIYVQEASSQARRLEEIGKEIGKKINVIEVPLEAESLIKNVSDGEIEYTVCNENIARVNSSFNPEIDVNTVVSSSRKLSWGVRKENSVLFLKELNTWIAAYRNTNSYALLYAKYFRNSRSGSIVNSDYYSINSGRVSKYDDLIRDFSSTIHWDWRLLASLICQESQFRADVVSIKGAYGLMQIMPITGRHFGIDITKSPENNMKAGIMYINWLYSIFDSRIVDEKERIYFVLAAYNAGPGHVLDAMKLAEKNGMDPQKWEDNVAVWLMKKSDSQYYTDTVVKNGYFRGNESVKFVSQVLDRYEHYKNIIR